MYFMSSTAELRNPERVNEEGTSMKIIHNPYVTEAKTWGNAKDNPRAETLP